MHSIKAALMLLLAAQVTPAVAVQLVDAEGACIGWANTASPNSQVARAVRCRGQARAAMAITAIGEIRAGRRCMGIAGAAPEPGLHPGGSIIWSGCIGTVNLLWSFDANAIKSRMHNLCLTRSKVADAGSSLYQMQPCDGSKRQQWRVLH